MFFFIKLKLKLSQNCCPNAIKNIQFWIYLVGSIYVEKVLINIFNI